MTTRPSYASMVHHASFEHEKLALSDQFIRLFQVQRGDNEEPVSLRMTQFSPRNRPKYKAVSYTWGSEANPKEILVNGKAFLLHRNLWHLLHRLRYEKETGFLWADALCINQFNLKERNFHVQLMGKIYAQADSVLVWLGMPTTDRVDINGMNFVKEIAAYRRHHSDTMFAAAYLKPEMQERWETLSRMCNPDNPAAYWKRTWVIQEFLFAQKLEVFAGKHNLEWKDFEDLIELLRSAPLYLQHPIISQILRSRTARLALRRKTESSLSLHELLREYSDSACTEPRDKIYGILGLAVDCLADPNTGETRGVRPDYEKHIIQVYLDALACIRKSLPSDADIPAAALLTLQALHIGSAEMVSFIKELKATEACDVLEKCSFTVYPEYVSPITKVWQWSSIRDLQQKLTNEDWGAYVGYKIQRVSSRTGPGSTTTRQVRRSFSQTVHNGVPMDFISKAIDAANLCTELDSLYNYPSSHDLEVPLEYLQLRDQDKTDHERSGSLKPPLILDQDQDNGSLRLGFACSNVQRNDLIIQFQGLDTTLIVRQVWHEYKLVGKAMMIQHRELQYDSAVDPICDTNPWASHCWRNHNPESLHFDTDALSLAELLNKP